MAFSVWTCDSLILLKFAPWFREFARMSKSPRTTTRGWVWLAVYTDFLHFSMFQHVELRPVRSVSREIRAVIANPAVRALGERPHSFARVAFWCVLKTLQKNHVGHSLGLRDRVLDVSCVRQVDRTRLVFRRPQARTVARRGLLTVRFPRGRVRRS